MLTFDNSFSIAAWHKQDVLNVLNESFYETHYSKNNTVVSSLLQNVTIFINFRSNKRNFRHKVHIQTVSLQVDDPRNHVTHSMARKHPVSKETSACTCNNSGSLCHKVLTPTNYNFSPHNCL